MLETNKTPEKLALESSNLSRATLWQEIYGFFLFLDLPMGARVLTLRKLVFLQSSLNNDSP